MPKKICEVCQSESIVTQVCSLLKKGSPEEEQWCRGITERARKGEISEEEYFKNLLARYGEERVRSAFDGAMNSGSAGSNLPDPQKPRLEIIPTQNQGVSLQPEHSPVTANVPAPPSSDMPAPSAQKRMHIPQAGKSEKGMSDLAGTAHSSVKGLCSACVMPPLMGIGIVLATWMLGEEKRRMERLNLDLEENKISIEDYVKDIFVKFGKSGKDNLDRILGDLNLVLEIGADRALKERPDLKQTIAEFKEEA